MGILTKLLWSPFAGRKVDDVILSDLAKVLETDLERKGLPRYICRCGPFVERLLNEAYVRAAEHQQDGIPRYGRMWSEIEDLSKKAISIYRGDRDVDPVLHRIFVHHGFAETL